MKRTFNLAIPLLAAAAIGGGLVFAPLAGAQPPCTGGHIAAAERCTTAPVGEGPTPPDVDGVDPLVPANTGAEPLVPWVPGYEQPF